jgi:hypothetical protein
MYFDVANRCRNGAKRDAGQASTGVTALRKGVFGATESRQRHRPQKARRTSNWICYPAKLRLGDPVSPTAAARVSVKVVRKTINSTGLNYICRR